MKSFFGVSNIFSVLLLLLLLTKCSLAATKNGKVHRIANTGQYPFARVGRTDPLQNTVDFESFESIYNVENVPETDVEGYQQRASLTSSSDAPELTKWAHLLMLQGALNKRSIIKDSTDLLPKSRTGKHSKIKNRRKGNPGMNPTARVGRSDPSLINNLRDIEDSEAIEIYGFDDGFLNGLEDYQNQAMIKDYTAA